MNEVKAMLIDDEPRGVAALQKLLELHCPQVQVIGSCIHANEAKAQLTRLRPQLVFLDIAMPEKNGLDLLRELNEINFEIIFITAHSHYMTQAFHFSAVDYLIKPVDDDLLVEAVKRATKRIEQTTRIATKENPPVQTFLHNLQYPGVNQKMKLCIPSMKGFLVVEIQDIIYCEANGNYTNFHFSNGSSIWSSKAVHEYEDVLSDCHFVRIHKSFLVNLEHIREYLRGEGGSVILSNGNEIEVSRRKKDFLLARMKEYYKF